MLFRGIKIDKNMDVLYYNLKSYWNGTQIPFLYDLRLLVITK